MITEEPGVVRGCYKMPLTSSSLLQIKPIVSTVTRHNMKLSSIVVGGLAALTIFECTYAYPGMGATGHGIKKGIQERQQMSGFRRLPSHARRETTKTKNSTGVQGCNEVEDQIESEDSGKEA